MRSRLMRNFVNFVAKYLSTLYLVTKYSGDIWSCTWLEIEKKTFVASSGTYWLVTIERT